MKIEEYVELLTAEFGKIGSGRTEVLNNIAEYIKTRVSEKEKVKLIFICTHNSRRSHIGQIWAKVAAQYYGIGNIETYSGGTEATSFYKSAVSSFERIGFRVEKEGSNTNPTYKVYTSDNIEVSTNFSKKYDHKVNPQKGFAAIMVCSSADEACPLIPGAEARFSLPYNDPKEFDNTPQEASKYDERSKEIARDMFYVMSKTTA